MNPLAGALIRCPIVSLPGARHDAARPASLPSETLAIRGQALRVRPH